MIPCTEHSKEGKESIGFQEFHNKRSNYLEREQEYFGADGTSL